MGNWRSMAVCVAIGVSAAAADAAAERNGPPMRIALVVDTSAATSDAMQQMRQGLLASQLSALSRLTTDAES